MPTTLDYIIAQTRSECSEFESKIRTTYSSELTQDKIDFAYTDPNDAPAGSLERRLQALFLNMSAGITQLEIDIDDGVI